MTSLKIDAGRFEKEKRRTFARRAHLCLKSERRCVRSRFCSNKGRIAGREGEALQVMTAEDLQAFADGIWQHAHVESLMMGNLDSSEAR